ncbi:chitinase 11-like [Triticum dicoccoides]|uniref:chitinase 11-like n=1 Tax=Triticum dicoccoides TaxID=85692 RepID=UPI00188F4647|nr:chitinase 11-like [Triticum dicoccoides]
MRVFGLLALAGAALLLAAAGTASGSVASIVTRDMFYSMLRQGHHGGRGGCDGGAFFYAYDAFVEAASTPDLVSSDPVVAFKTAIWFWMTPRHGAQKTPSCHAVMTGGWRPSRRDDRRAGRLPGYGMTTNIMSGGLACGKRHGTPQGSDRVWYYKRYCRLLRVRLGRNVACINQKPYGHGG